MPDWIDKAKETYNFHVRMKREDEDWTIRNTANSLRRSLGSVSEDLLIGSWLKTHRPQLEKFSFQYEALKFIRAKEKEQHWDEIE